MTSLSSKEIIPMSDKFLEFTKEQDEMLRKPFPKEAFQPDRSRVNKNTGQGPVMTSIKAQYVIERLCDVFGVTGWEMNGEYQETDNGVLYIGYLLLKDFDHKIQSVGFMQKRYNVADAYKGSRTDALSKACSQLLIGNEVFKGNVNLHAYYEYEEKVEVQKDKPTKSADRGLLNNKSSNNSESAEEVDFSTHVFKTSQYKGQQISIESAQDFKDLFNTHYHTYENKLNDKDKRDHEEDYAAARGYLLEYYPHTD